MGLKLNNKACKVLEKVREFPGVIASEYSINGKSAIVIDAGVNASLPKEEQERIGLLIAEASMGTLGEASINDGCLDVRIPLYPPIATLGCQLAGWPIEISGKNALGSGPARILAKKPRKLMDKLGYSESSSDAVLILETDKLPNEETCARILKETDAQDLHIAAFRPQSTVGLINILARVAEVSIYRLSNIGFDVSVIESASGIVPIPKDPEDAMSAGNEAIIYKGKVNLSVRGWRSEVACKAVSSGSNSYGRSFKELLDLADGDFYKMDPGIFAPAKLEVTDLIDGKEYSVGRIRE